MKDVSEKEKAFVRDDYDNWNMFEIYVVGGLLLVPRLSSFIVFTFLHYCVLKVVTSLER